MKRSAMLFLLALAFTGFVYTPRVMAQATQSLIFNPNKSAEDHGKIVNDAAVAGVTNKEIYSDDSVTDYMNATTCKTKGCDSVPGHVYYYGNSAIASLGRVIAGTFSNPPANVAFWLDDVGQDLGFKPRRAYAQGIGFTGFSGLLPLWKLFRNIAYFLLAIIMIVIGFMVMFRKKIDPKTVVTVQNALPRIVITLLLITFSYAIVGLLVDVMYLVMYLAVSMFMSTGLLLDPGPVSSFIARTNSTPAFYAQGNLFANIVQATSTLNIFKLFGTNYGAVQGTIQGGIAGAVLLAISGIVASGGTAIPLIGLGGIATMFAIPLIEFLLALAMLFLFIRLLIFFIGTYIQIVLAMLFGPVQILFEAIPGTNSFASWAQNLIANLAVFPVGVIFFMLSSVFSKFADQSHMIWSPGLSSLTATATGISSLISFGILFAIPSVGASIKEALKAKPFVNAGPEGIAGAFAAPIGTTMQMLQIWQSHESVRAMKNLPGVSGLQTKDKPAG